MYVNFGLVNYTISNTKRRPRMDILSWIWNILSWILVGLVAGVIAKLLMPGRDPGGCIITILLGIAGALLGGFLAGLFGFGGITGFNLYTLIVAVLGSILILVLYRLVFRPGRD
jgi:uncharacterized membrane protein YeaQ/YmgE (transglycosylase-associated protein family)